MSLKNLISELESEREQLRKELEEILKKHKWDIKDVENTSAYITKRWVKARGYVYFYYYLIIKHKGQIVKNKYLGKTVAPHVKRQVEDLKRAKKLLRRIRAIERSLKRIEKEIGGMIRRE